VRKPVGAPLAVPQRRALQRRTIAVLAAGEALAGLAVGLVFPMSTLLAVELSGSTAAAGLPGTAWAALAAVGAHWLALLAARRGRRTALCGGLLFAAIATGGMLAASAVHSFAVLMVAAPLFGLALVVLFQARFAATDLAEPATRGRDLSLVIWAVTPGIVAGPSLSSWASTLGEAVGLNPLGGPFLVATAALAAGALVLFLGLRPDPLLMARLPLDGAPMSPAGPSGGVGGHSFMVGLAAIRTARPALLGTVAVVGVQVVMVAIMTATPLHLEAGGAAAGHAHALTLTVIGLTLSVHFAGMYALSPVMGWLVDRVGRVTMLLAGLGAVSLALVTAGIGQGSQPWVAVGLGLLGLGWSCTIVAGSTLLAESVPPEGRVPAQGVTDSLLGAAAAVGAAVSGWMYGAFGFEVLNLSALVMVGALGVWALRNARAVALRHAVAG